MYPSLCHRIDRRTPLAARGSTQRWGQWCRASDARLLTECRTRHPLEHARSAYSALLCCGASVGWGFFSLTPRKKIKQRIARTTKKAPAVLKRVVPLNSKVRGGDLDQTNWGSVAATLLIKPPQSNGATNPRNNPRAASTSALFISQ